MRQVTELSLILVSKTPVTVLQCYACVCVSVKDEKQYERVSRTRCFLQCGKLKKKGKNLLGSMQMAHNGYADDVDKAVVDAR